MFEIRQEKLSSKWGELQPLLEAHWEELAKQKDIMVLKPWHQGYEILENNNAMVNIFAYDEGGSIVGYCLSIIQRNLHYQNLNMCVNDVLFVLPQYRNSPLGLKLISITERLAKESGCNIVVWRAKPGSQLDKLFKIKKGYSEQDISYIRRLEN